MPAPDAHPIPRPRTRAIATALAGSLAALLLSAAGGPAAAQAIVGRVVDAESGAAVAGALVSVSGGGQRGSRQATAGDDGRYSLALPGGGTFRVQARRTGYGSARARTVSVGPNDTVHVDVRLPPAAVPLRGVTATARPRRLPVRGKFVQTGGGDSAALKPVSAEMVARNIVARGSFVTPSACYQLAGVADRLRSVVTLYIDARPNGDMCYAVPAVFDYAVTVRGLPPGSYTFRILHTYRDGVLPPTMTMDTTMVVPERTAPRR